MREPGSTTAASFGTLLLVAAMSLAHAASAQEHTPPVEETEQADARDAYSAGLAAYARGAYTEAVREFTRADGLSASPNAKLMLGRCLRQLDQLPAAYQILVSIVRPPEALDPRYAQTRSAAEEELRTVRNQIGILTVYVRAEPRSALLHVNGQPVPASEWHSALPVRPGLVRLSLETAPGVIERREVELAAGQRSSVVIGTPDTVITPTEVAAPSPAPAAPAAAAAASPAPHEPVESVSGLRVASYIAGGTSALSFVAFGVFGALSSANFAKLEAECPDRNQCDPSLETLATTGRTQQTIANVALAVGIASLGAGITLFVLGDAEDRDSAEHKAATRLAITPLGLSLRGEL